MAKPLNKKHADALKDVYTGLRVMTEDRSKTSGYTVIKVYQPPTLGLSKPDEGKSSQRIDKFGFTLLGYYVLPLPKDLSDNDSIDYSNDWFTGAKDKMYTEIANIGGAISKSIFGAEASRKTSTQPNLYSGHQHKSWDLSYELLPRSKKETDTIITFINSIRALSIPALEDDLGYQENWIDNVGNSDYFDNYKMEITDPLIFDVDIVSVKDSETVGVVEISNKIPVLRKCVLTKINVNYTSDMGLRFFEDGSPISYKIDLSFKELQKRYANFYVK